MSSGQETNKADSYDNGAPRAADPTASLTDKERATLTKILANPLDFPAEFPGWLDDFVRLRLTVSNIAGFSTLMTGETGELLVVLADYTAQTSAYTIEFKNQTWMYLNGATFDASVYASLNTYLGTNVLPDTRGRSLWLTGTHTALDLFDADAVAEPSRQPTQTDTVNITISISGTTGSASATRTDNFPQAGSEFTGTHSHSFSGSGSDSDTVSITPPYVAIGSAFVHV